MQMRARDSFSEKLGYFTSIMALRSRGAASASSKSELRSRRDVAPAILFLAALLRPAALRRVAQQCARGFFVIVHCRRIIVEVFDHLQRGLAILCSESGAAESPNLKAGACKRHALWL